MWNWKSYFSRVVLVLIPHLIAQLIPILKVYFITWENGFFYFFLSQENPAKYSGISIKQTPLVQKKSLLYRDVRFIKIFSLFDCKAKQLGLF